MPPEKQPVRDLGERLFLNSLSGAVRFAVTSVVLLLLYPLMLKHLGASRFGLWAVLGMTGQYVALGDFGVLNALVKLAAEESLDRTKLRALAGAAVLTILGLAIVFLVVITLGYHLILSWLRIAPEFIPEARMLLLATPGLICLQLMGTTYTSLLSGLQRMDLANVIWSAAFVANAVGIAVALKFGGGLIELMLVGVLVAFLTWFSAILTAMRITGEQWGLLPAWVPSTVVELLRFGAPLYLAALAGLLLEPSMKVLLSRYGGLTAVSSFELASRIATQCRSFFHHLLLPTLPASSFLSGDPDRLRRMYRVLIRVLQVTAVPAFLVLAGFAPAIVGVWLGENSSLLHNGMTVLLVGWLFNVLTIPAYLVVQGMGHPRFAMICSAVQGALALLGGSLLISRMGFYGAVGSVAMALFVAAVYIQRQFLRLCPGAWEELFPERAWRKLVAPVALTVLLVFVRLSGFADSVLFVLVFGTAGIAIYLALLLRVESPGMSPRAFVEGFLAGAVLEKVVMRDR